MLRRKHEPCPYLRSLTAAGVGKSKRALRVLLLAEVQAFFPHEPDHIVAFKHGGETVPENLALACFDCNRFKGSDIASVDPLSGDVTSLFNPRTQQWSEHFRLLDGRILPL